MRAAVILTLLLASNNQIRHVCCREMQLFAGCTHIKLLSTINCKEASFTCIFHHSCYFSSMVTVKQTIKPLSQLPMSLVMPAVCRLVFCTNDQILNANIQFLPSNFVARGVSTEISVRQLLVLIPCQRPAMVWCGSRNN